MSGTVTIRLKAFFLLLVFAMNSLLGFACSVGIDLGYNRHHHNSQENTYSVEADNEMMHNCGTDTEIAGKANDGNVPENTQDCCKDGVLKFNLSDKSVSSAVKFDAPFQTALNTALMYLISSLNLLDIPSDHYYVRSDHPPILKDIRVSIQSFQI